MCGVSKKARWCAGVGLVWLVMGACAAPVARAQGAAGRLDVSFLYMPPTTIDPTYHTAIWLEDDQGLLVKTLYVSQELSSTEYKVGKACPDWVKKARWDKAPKSEVDAVTAPTPNVGSESKVFDLGALGLKPGTYGFMFQVHIGEQHNVLYRGKVVVGGPNAPVTLEMTQGPGKLLNSDVYIKDVVVRYRAPVK